MFSVILPTLQRSPWLLPVLDIYREHPLVAEVIVINNAGPRAPLPRLGPKVRVLDQDENIFVNPAWNLGAREAQSEHLIVSNDDVLFPPSLIDAVACRLGPSVGMIGPHTRCRHTERGRPPIFVPAYERKPLYGVLFFMARSSWVPIPDDLLVWCGDDWLFSRQTERNYFFVGPQVRTPMAVTSGSPEFSAQKYADLATYRSRYAHDDPYLERFGREARLAGGALRATHRLLGRGTTQG